MFPPTQPLQCPSKSQAKSKTDMTVSRVVSIVLCFLVALPGDLDTLVSRSIAQVRIPQQSNGLVETSPEFQKTPDRAKIVNAQDERCEFDEAGDPAPLVADLPLAADLGWLPWPLPIAVMLVGDPLPHPFCPVSSWRLLGRYRC